MQSNLVAVQRNYMPFDSIKQHENLSTDNRSAKSRKMISKNEKTATISSAAEQNQTKKFQSNLTAAKEQVLNSSRQNQKMNYELDKSSFMEDVRGFFKAVTSNAEGFFNVFNKFRLG